MMLGGQERLLNVNHLILNMKLVHFNVILSDGIMEKMKKDLVHGIYLNMMIHVRRSLSPHFISLVFLASESNPLKISSYQPTTDEWPPHGEEIERERLLTGIDTLMQIDVAKQFLAPGK